MRERDDEPLQDEPGRDAELGRLLGLLDDGPDADGRRTAALGDRVLMAAGPALARLRAAGATEAAPSAAAPVRRPDPGAGWWEWVGGWSPVAVPLSLAAAALVLLAAVRLPATPLPAAAAGPLTGVVVERSVSDQAVLAAVAGPRAEAADTLVGPATGEWLLAAAMQLELPADDPAADPGMHEEDSMATVHDDRDPGAPEPVLPADDGALPAEAADSGVGDPGRGASR